MDRASCPPLPIGLIGLMEAQMGDGGPAGSGCVPLSGGCSSRPAASPPAAVLRVCDSLLLLSGRAEGSGGFSPSLVPEQLLCPPLLDGLDPVSTFVEKPLVPGS